MCQFFLDKDDLEGVSEGVQKAIFDNPPLSEERRAVPPKPETIKQAMIDVRRYGRITADTFVKRNIPLALRELEMVLEESNAYYR